MRSGYKRLRGLSKLKGVNKKGAGGVKRVLAQVQMGKKC